jgi:hypothetical protein
MVTDVVALYPVHTIYKFILVLIGMIYPMLMSSILAGILMPNNISVRGEQIITVRERTHCKRNLFSVEVIVWIVGNFSYHISDGEGKVSREKSTRYRRSQLREAFSISCPEVSTIHVMRFEEHASLGSKTVKLQVQSIVLF